MANDIEGVLARTQLLIHLHNVGSYPAGQGGMIKAKDAPAVASLKPGQKVTFTVQRGAKVLEIGFRLGSKEAMVYRVEELPSASRAQLTVRRGWLKGETGKGTTAGD